MHVLAYSKLAPKFRVGSMRSWDAYPGIAWSDINTLPGVYGWSGMDAYISRAQSHGADVVYVFGRTPRWASAQPNSTVSPYGQGQCAPPAKLEDWDRFVRAIVSHASGRIKYWEVWNEPQDPRFYCGDVDTMVAMAQRAYEIIKGIDPSAMVISPSPTGWGSGGRAARWMNSFLAKGGGRYADIIAFHGYGTFVPERIVRIVAEVKSVLARHEQLGKPLWNTEASWSGSEGLAPPDETLRAAFLARYYLVQWPLGVSRFHWYAYDGGRWGGLRDDSGGLLLDGIAYRTMYEWLVGATMAAPCSGTGIVWTCSLNRPGGYQALAVWTTAGEASFRVPAEYRQYRDLIGQAHPVIGGSVRIGAMPILLEGSAPPPR